MHWFSSWNLRLFRFGTAQTHFLFKGSFYDQVDGVSMGPFLAPVLADLFMAHLENACIANFTEADILFYVMTMTRLVWVFATEQDAVSFHNYFNSQHPNIRFTMEKEVDGKLVFFDVLVNNNVCSPNTSIFRENFHSSSQELFQFPHNSTAKHPAFNTGKELSTSSHRNNFANTNLWLRTKWFLAKIIPFKYCFRTSVPKW